jgi:hypothetical protein
MRSPRTGVQCISAASGLLSRDSAIEVEIRQGASSVAGSTYLHLVVTAGCLEFACISEHLRAHATPATFILILSFFCDWAPLKYRIYLELIRAYAFLRKRLQRLQSIRFVRESGCILG